MADRLLHQVGDLDKGQLVQVTAMPAQEVPSGTADFLWKLSRDGRLFCASDAALGDKVTGQISLVNTSPTFALVPGDGVIVVPLLVDLGQGGTVGGDVIEMAVELDEAQARTATGTAETIRCVGLGSNTSQSQVLSTVTASAGYGVRLFGRNLGQDVSPAEGAPNEGSWRPSVPLLMAKPHKLFIYTSAGTTGPTWWWSIYFAEFPTSELSRYLP